MKSNLKAKLKRISIVTIPYRFCNVLYYYCFPKIVHIFKWSLKSKELHSYTYNLTSFNNEYLIHDISIITNLPYAQVQLYFNEIFFNNKLKKYIIEKIENSEYKYVKDKRVELGNRFLHYCIIRAIKPKIIVENGIEIGFTSIILCEALLKNIKEGFIGKYYGLDINPIAGYLIKNRRYTSIAEILIGDSLKSLSTFEKNIDYYFSDGERTYKYEKVEFELLKTKVNINGIVVSNKLQISNCTSIFAKEMNRRHIYFREDPFNHWYPGSHIGIVF
jgi:hypothetical protein